MQQNKLYVGNFPFNVTESQLQERFAPYGEIEQLSVIMDRDTGRPKGFAFITYALQQSAEKALERIHHWREVCPDITLRSTFIVGFPGETERDFALLLDFLREAQLDRVGCFQYSPVRGAGANDLPDPVPEVLKQERWERFMALQQEISAARLQAKIGRTIEILIDEADAQGAVGRSAADAPEIDGRVFLDGVGGLQPGDLVEAQVTGADEYDLWAG